MANFTNDTFITHDDWFTPKSAWEDIKEYIPTDKVLWEAFYGDGESGNYLSELGFNTIHEPVDFFSNNLGDVVVTNPAFSMIPEVLEKLKEDNKPFIMIMPSSKINTQYFRNLFCNNDDPIQIIIPKKRIKFTKSTNGVLDKKKQSPNFDCFYYCWKIGLERDITWLD